MRLTKTGELVGMVVDVLGMLVRLGARRRRPGLGGKRRNLVVWSAAVFIGLE